MPLLRASFGDLLIGVQAFEHEGGQDWAEHSPTRGSRHTLQPRGKKMARTPCEIVFIGSRYFEEHERFSSMVDEDKPHLFVHPVRGSYLAVVKDYRYRMDADAGVITAQCVFVEYEPPTSVSPVGSLASSGSEAVLVAKQRAESAATNAGVTVSSPAVAHRATSNWERAQLGAKALELEVSAVVARIDSEISSLHSWASWPVIKELIGTRRLVLHAAESLLAQTEQVKTFVVESPAPLMTIAARLYGGERARALANEIRELNGLSDTGLVRAGTKLKVPA